VINAIVTTARTGHIGDGKSSYRALIGDPHRNDERGETAL